MIFAFLYDAATDPSSPFDLLNIVNKGGLIGLFVLILFGGFRKWWVFGWQLRDAEERIQLLINSNDKWMEVALRGTKAAESITALAKDKHDESVQN